MKKKRNIKKFSAMLLAFSMLAGSMGMDKISPAFAETWLTEEPETVELEQEIPDTVEMVPEVPEAVETEPEAPDAAETEPEAPDAAETEPEVPDAAETEPEAPDTAETEPETPDTVDMVPAENSGEETEAGDTVQPEESAEAPEAVEEDMPQPEEIFTGEAYVDDAADFFSEGEALSAENGAEWMTLPGETLRLTAEAGGMEIVMDAPKAAFPYEGELSLYAESIEDERLAHAKATIEEILRGGQSAPTNYLTLSPC